MTIRLNLALVTQNLDPRSSTARSPRDAPVRRVWRSVLNLLLALGVWCFSSGCGKDIAEEAGDSDANAYFCRGCKAKFFTERAVFAAHCPACRSADLAPVIGFLCDKDGYTTITPRERDSIECEKCQSRLVNIRLPHEKELRAWGAEKKNKADVIP